MVDERSRCTVLSSPSTPNALPADVYAFNGVEHARYHHAVLHILVSATQSPPQLPACLPACLGIRLPGCLNGSPRTLALFAACLQGERGALWASIFQCLNLVLVCIAYT